MPCWHVGPHGPGCDGWVDPPPFTPTAPIIVPFAFDPHGGCAQREGELTAKVKALELQNRELQNAVDRANAAMLKHQKHNGALEMALQDAHRDTDEARAMAGRVEANLNDRLKELEQTHRLIHEIKATMDRWLNDKMPTCCNELLSGLIDAVQDICKTEKRNDLLPIPPPLTVDTVVPDGKCWLCGRAATGKKGAEPRCEMHL